MRKIYAINLGDVLIHDATGARYQVQEDMGTRIIVKCGGETRAAYKKHFAMMLKGGSMRIEKKAQVSN